MDDATILRLTGIPDEGMEAANGMDLCGCLAMQVDRDGLCTLIDRLDHYQTTGPIFDPTNWMRHGTNARNRAKLARTFLAFRTEFEAYMQSIRADADRYSPTPDGGGDG